ncbi:MAG TPA: lytic transglycosylase domain-containing protein [Caulobacteraceae bacterium]|jgi:soluble lytic murein transglycosylase-like protein|nr:lytic transglycosylase domain-containing protein [Caulobacteraceae bacterium]
MTIRRGALTALAALVAGVSSLAFIPTQAEAAPQALSPWDAQLYAAAFDALKRGDVSAVETNLAQVKDRCLVGMVEFDKLFKLKGYKASYEELTTWLSQYGDLPMAPRVWALAKKRKPDGAPDPTPPTGVANDTPHTWSSMQSVPLSATGDIDPLDPKAPRLALNAGDLQTAIMLADASGDRWVGGLAAYRMKNYDEAFRRFQLIALDVSEAPWDRSRAGYWAARAAIAKGSPDQSPELLRIAAQFPRTFYGQIAERQLGLQPGSFEGGVPYTMLQSSPIVRASLTTSTDLDSPVMRRFIDSEPRAKRALALAEIGQKVDAGIEIRAGLGLARDEEARSQWTSLALGINGMFPAYSAEADARDYPMPDLAPQGGFTVDKALVYALIRQESGFKPRAHSFAGAYGLMQVMPSNAAWLERDASFRANPDRLFDPGTNLRVGQDYVLYLMSQPDISGDILKTVAAYDGGPAPVYQSMKQVGYGADDLLTIESIPVPETRDYVERVMANYWIYKRMLGEKTKTLDAVADGDRVVQVALDRSVANPMDSLAATVATRPAVVIPLNAVAPPVPVPTAGAAATPVSDTDQQQ